jgi:cell wall-associated NlpC family hydrolase
LNKKFVPIIAGSTMLLLTMCSSVALGKSLQNDEAETVSYTVPTERVFLTIDTKPATLLEYQSFVYERKQEQKRLKNKELKQNLSDLKVAIDNTSKYIDKTWYVFSGSTPEGWDCSGLVRWTFSHMGFDLHHSATAQMEFGNTTKKPKFGDVVGFKYHGASMYYHVGIYISEDLMLHSGGKRGDKTELRSISNFAGEHSKASYSRLVETN